METRKMKAISRWYLAVWILSISLVVSGDNAPPLSKMAQYEESLNKEIKLEKEQQNQVIKMVGDMVTIMKDYDASAQNDNGISGLGRIEQLQFKAERYSAERQIRKRLENELSALYDTVREWQNIQERVKEWQRLLDTEKQLQTIRKAASEVKSPKNVSALDIENIEYFTLKNAATLKEISALPEVYGNENAWRYLYDANRDKIEQPNATLAAGTTLVVPNIKDKGKFVNLE